MSESSGPSPDAINAALHILMTGGTPEVELPGDMRVPETEGTIMRRAEVYPHGCGVVAIATRTDRHDFSPLGTGSRLVGTGGH